MKAEKVFLVSVTVIFSRTQKFQCLIIGLKTPGLCLTHHRYRGVCDSLRILPKCF